MSCSRTIAALLPIPRRLLLVLVLLLPQAEAAVTYSYNRAQYPSQCVELDPEPGYTLSWNVSNGVLPDLDDIEDNTNPVMWCNPTATSSCRPFRCSQYYNNVPLPSWVPDMPVDVIQMRLRGAEDDTQTTPQVNATATMFLGATMIGQSVAVVNGQFPQHPPWPPGYVPSNSETGLMRFGLLMDDWGNPGIKGTTLTDAQFSVVFYVNKAGGDPVQISKAIMRGRMRTSVTVTEVESGVGYANSAITVVGTNFFNGDILCRYASDPDEPQQGTYSNGKVLCPVPLLHLDAYQGEIVELSFNDGAKYTNDEVSFDYEPVELLPGITPGTVVRLGAGVIALIILASVTVVGAFAIGSYRLAVMSGVLGGDEADDIKVDDEEEGDEDEKQNAGDGDDANKNAARASLMRRSADSRVSAVTATIAVARARMTLRQDEKQMRRLVRSQQLSLTSAMQAGSIVDIVRDVSAASVAVVKAVQYLERTALDLEGVFRVSGALEEVKQIAKTARSSPHMLRFDVQDPHAVASWLKLYFRKRSSPAVPAKVVEVYRKKHATGSLLDSAFALKDQIAAMTPRPRAELELMCRLASKVTENAQHTKMTLDNMTMVLGPTMVRHDDLKLSFSLMGMLIRLCGLIFGVDDDIGAVTDSAVDALAAINVSINLPGQAPPPVAKAASDDVPPVPPVPSLTSSTRTPNSRNKSSPYQSGKESRRSRSPSGNRSSSRSPARKSSRSPSRKSSRTASTQLSTRSQSQTLQSRASQSSRSSRSTRKSSTSSRRSRGGMRGGGPSAGQRSSVAAGGSRGNRSRGRGRGGRRGSMRNSTSSRRRAGPAGSGDRAGQGD